MIAVRVGGRGRRDGGRRAVQTVYAPNNPQSVTAKERFHWCELELSVVELLQQKVKQRHAPRRGEYAEMVGLVLGDGGRPSASPRRHCGAPGEKPEKSRRQIFCTFCVGPCLARLPSRFFEIASSCSGNPALTAKQAPTLLSLCERTASLNSRTELCILSNNIRRVDGCRPSTRQITPNREVTLMKEGTVSLVSSLSFKEIKNG